MNKKAIAWIIAGMILTSGYAFSVLKMNGYRSGNDMPERASALMVSPELLQLAAGEFSGVLADYLLLKASIFLGGRYTSTKEDWMAVYVLFKQSLALDPYFFLTCFYTQANLPWRPDMTEKAIELLKISSTHRDWDWQPDFYIGFDYYYHLSDNLSGSKYLMAASKKPGAPPLLGLLGARLAQKEGQTNAGITFLKAMHANEENERKKDQIQQRINALEGVLILEKAVETFRQKTNRPPKDLDELVATGILSSLPENPYGEGYIYNPETGTIAYDPY